MEEEGLLCICQTIAKSSVFLKFHIGLPFLFRLWFRVGVKVCLVNCILEQLWCVL